MAYQLFTCNNFHPNRFYVSHSTTILILRHMLLGVFAITSLLTCGVQGMIYHNGQVVLPTANCIEQGQEAWFCTERYDPVCGIDGNTYPSCCFARVYGVQYLTSHTACQSDDGRILPPIAFLSRYIAPEPEQEMDVNSTEPIHPTDLVTTDNALENHIEDFPYFRKRSKKNRRSLLETYGVNQELSSETIEAYFPDFTAGGYKQNGIGVSMGAKFKILQDVSENFHTPEILIGEDDTRVAINDSTATPFAMIGQLEVGCTAALIGSRYVITAAHCILDRFDRELRDLDFSPAKNGHFEPYGKFEWFSFFLPKAWVENKTASADFAVIVYKNNIADVVGGYLDLQVDCAKELYILNVAGYPSDKTPDGSLYATSCQGVELRCTDMTLIHTCDTFGGMSGAPMISYRKDQDPAFAIRAIHTGGNRQLQLNFGTNITPKVRDTIRSWMKQAEQNFAPLLDYVVSSNAIMKLKAISVSP